MERKKFTLRLSEDDLEKLENASKRLGISKNDYITMLVQRDNSEINEEILAELKEIKDLLKQ